METRTKTRETFRIYNNTKATFSFMDRIRILFGKELTVSVTIHADKEVEVFNELTEHSVRVAPFIEPKPTLMSRAVN